MQRFLGVDIEHTKDGSFHMHQRFLIDRILKALDLDEDSYEASKRLTIIPSVKPILIDDLNGEQRIQKWRYRSVIRMLNYLAGTIRLDIAMTVHQTAQFCIDPKLSHKRAVIRIGKSRNKKV